VPNILLAQEDTGFREEFARLILDFFPTTHIQTAKEWAELPAALSSVPAPSVLLADILWGGEDRSPELLLLAESHPVTSFAVFGRYDLAGSLPPGYPIPLLQPDEHLPLRLSESMENLSGTLFGPYQASAPAGPHLLGRLYWGRHQQLQRDVQLLVPPAGSATFAKAIRAMARVHHAAVYALYESVPWENRIVVAMEPPVHPSLLHYRMAGTPVPLGTGARLATALGSIHADMESWNVPARLLGEYDYTLSPQGVPRLRNPVAHSGMPEVTAMENAKRLAGLLEPLLERDTKTQLLISLLRNPGPSAFDLIRRAREFERQLAEFKEIHVRKEEIEATKKTMQARVRRRWVRSLGTVSTALFLLGAGWLVFQKFLANRPARLTHEEIRIPAGEVILDGKSATVPAFALDRHEVTIGDYETFLTNLVYMDWKQFLPAGYTKTSQSDFEPKSWKTQLARARNGDALSFFLPRGVRITRDSPVCGVDYASAYAYANWKERRLPNREEWVRAATGNDRRTYPWGNTPPGGDIHLGGEAAKKFALDAGLLLQAPAGSFPADRAPFGHMDMGGNLSEWITPSNDALPGLMGGNFADEAPVANSLPPRRLAEADARVGFRTAR